MKKLLWVALLITCFAAPIGAATLNVPAQYPTIQAAVNAANSGDVVLVASGTYSDVVHQPGGDDTTRCAVIMKSGVTLRGSGPGSTIINADSLGRGIHCSNVTGVTIRDLKVIRAFAPVLGSAILVKDTSNVAIFNCEISNNFDGGIIYIKDCGGSISTTTIRDNLAKQGGGLSIEERCNVTVTRCTVQGNQAPSGGGVFVRAQSITRFDDCTVQGNFINTLSGSGGGMMFVSSTPTVTNCRILNNISDGSGGGVAVFDGSVVSITKSTIQGNRTDGDYGPGGGVYCDFSTLTMDDCLIARNVVEGGSSDGAGVFVFFGSDAFGTPVVLNQVTISANANNSGQAGGAGGVALFFSSPTISKSIISHNSPGKAMVCLDAGDNPVVSCSDLFSNQGGNAICGTDGGNNFSLDPLFCDLANNNFRLQMTSPCYPGQHPDGGSACGGQRIGGVDPGCNPADATDGDVIPAATRILGNDPNPFHPSTTISFELDRTANIRLGVFDVAGRQVRLLAEGALSAGRHRVRWDGKNEKGELAPSGVYFYRLQGSGLMETRRMVLTR